MPRVRELEVFRLVLPYGRRPESILVKLTDYGGMTGWGEVVQGPGRTLPGPVAASAEAGEEADEDEVAGARDNALAKTWAALEESLGPALLGVDWEHPDELTSLPASSAVDLACWDLWARMRGVPLAHAIGGTRTSVVATVRLPAERSLEAMVARVNRHVCAGYAHVTLDVHPGWDVEPVRAVRAAYPALALAVDARGVYTDVTALAALDAYDVTAIERPFGGFDTPPDLALHAELQGRVSSLVAVEVHSVAALEQAIAARAASALLLRPSRFGTLRAARTAHDRAAAAGWDITAAGGRGTGLARAATVAVASLPGCTLPGDVTEPPRNAQIVTPPVGASGGVVAVPLTQPGLGHLVDEDRVRRLARDSFRL
ncbi:o-succinylbenzoate synthase [Sphaerisporangium krabiense]|uniref:O-succinylbenzoate synthase n=1 Tax=Sphaerisporangium krabiense TaxID=763782 RepID=A0A7W8ZAQ4_9ACTN|nr:enolase C-terminal domain-like protein [Sphaerisporangium krabiense]MBB5630597.1 O-succinylbenzoate synthase [Sphaerisporangium krabiense]GII62447.1 o-succinylbenzoate synthase [Sphaerisporangium krabiense]